MDHLEALDARFRDLMFGHTVLMSELKVGDWFIHVVVPEQLVKVTKHAYVGTEGEYARYWTHATASRITAADVEFIRANAVAYKIWLIEGLDGLKQRCISPAVESAT